MTYPIGHFTLIIGAMKCGTTSLFNYLAEHPQVAPSKAKEPNFFTHDKSWKKGISHYRTLWDFDPAIHQTALEASINYSKVPRLPNAAKRIYQMAQQESVNFKFIYIIRDPIERIISHCTHDLEEQWSVRYNHPIVCGIPYPAIEISKYAMQLSEYSQRFPAENILLLQADELRLNPQRVLNTVCAFLDIDTAFKFHNIKKQHNPSKGKPVTNRFWPKMDKYVASPMIRYLPRHLRSPAMSMLRGWFSTGQIQQKFQISEQQRKFILEELHSDIQELHSQYEINVSQWGCHGLEFK
ncbi:MAG: sulfotransferase [Cyanobacteria bacterium J06560_5]